MSARKQQSLNPRLPDYRTPSTFYQRQVARLFGEDRGGVQKRGDGGDVGGYVVAAGFVDGDEGGVEGEGGRGCRLRLLLYLQLV